MILDNYAPRNEKKEGRRKEDCARSEKFLILINMVVGSGPNRIKEPIIFRCGSSVRFQLPEDSSRTNNPIQRI